MHSTGYICTPAINGNNNNCLLTYIGSFDKESVLLVSADLLGESNELQQSFQALKLVLAKQYGQKLINNNNSKLIATT
jgi:hypothetical protein